MKKELFIEGMSCMHCVSHVEDALKEVEGIKSVKVDLHEKKAVIELTYDVNDDKLKEAIEEAGYELIKIQ